MIRRPLQELANLFATIVPLLPLAALASASSGPRLSLQILGGLVLAAALSWSLRRSVSVTLMPIIALSVVGYGMEVKTAVLSGAVVGFVILVLSFSRWFVPLLSLVPANVFAGMNAAIAAVILQRGIQSLPPIAALREVSIGTLLNLALWMAITAGAAVLVVRGKPGTALVALFGLTAVAVPSALLRVHPNLSFHLMSPDPAWLRSSAFNAILPEFFCTGVAVVIAAARLSANSRQTDSVEETRVGRIAGAVASIAAYPVGFIPAVPALAPQATNLATADRRPRILPALAGIGLVIALSGIVDGLAAAFPAFVVPALCVVAAWPFVCLLKPVVDRKDQFVAFATMVTVLLSRSFGWGLVAGVFAAALVRMVRGESPLCHAVEELRDL
jgi:hypothetical protein